MLNLALIVAISTLLPLSATEPPQDIKHEAAAPAKYSEADRKAATEALREVISAYRGERGIDASVEVVVGAKNAAADGGAPPVKAKFLFGSKRRAVISMRDFTLRLTSGRIIATHDSNQLVYLDVSDHGSPYYALFNAFQSLPIPELALALGEEELSDVCMQLIPSLPDVLPASVGDAEVDGQACRAIVLESDDASQRVTLYIDPETKLLEGALGEMLGGPNVEPGAALRWKVTSKSSFRKQPPEDATFAFDTSGRQKVDGLAALIDRRPGAAEDRDVEALKAGEPAPALALPKLGGGDWDIVAARTKPVLVDFWATWCGPCKAALPGIAETARQFDGKVEVMLINAGEQGSREDREANIKKVFEAAKVQLPCALDLDGLAARRWLIRAFPSTFVIAPDGKIAGVWQGTSPAIEREIRAKLAELCGGAKPEGPKPETPKPETPKPGTPKPEAPTPGTPKPASK